MSRVIYLGPDEIPAFLLRQDDPVTDEIRMRRLPVHAPVPAKAVRNRSYPSSPAVDVMPVGLANGIPRYLQGAG